MTPLHLAVRYDRLAVVSMLLEWGADVEARNVSGDTAIKLATDTTIRDMLNEALQIYQAKVARGSQILHRNLLDAFYRPGGPGAVSAIKRLNIGRSAYDSSRM